jgi:subtilase family serine protease
MPGKYYVHCSIMFLLLVFMGTACDQKKPDLEVDHITLTPTNPTSCDQILFKAVIKNNGKMASPASKAAIRVGGETYPQKFNISPLSPGASHAIRRAETLDVAQNYKITVYADYTNAVSESNEKNNETYNSFTVTKACPDLMVKSITLTPTNPTTSEAIKFEASIVNMGNCAAPVTRAAMWIGGETSPGIFNVPALNPGAAHVINRWERLNIAQNYRVRVHANHGNNADECNDTNNEKYKDFRVQ